MIIGIDNGNANTKTVNTVFVSGLTKFDKKPPVAEDLIYWNGYYYSLTGKRNFYQQDKTTNENCFILSLFGIAKEILIEKGADFVNADVIRMSVDLGVGLPPEHYGIQKDKFQQYFLSFGNTVEFVYNDTKFNITIRTVQVFPQAYAAVAQKASELKSYSQTYVIDIGGYTTDVLLLKKNKPDLTICRSLESGIITMNNNIISRINSGFGKKIEEEHIYDVLLGRKTILTPDIKAEIKEEANKHALNILHQLREQNVDLTTTPGIFIGGGSLLLKESILSSGMVIPTEDGVDFITNISANAVGYQLLTKAYLRKNNLA